MMTSEDWMQAIAKDAFEASVKKAVENFFATRWGYGDQQDVSKALRSAVEEMIRTDPEIRARIKKRLLEVIDRGESRA